MDSHYIETRGQVGCIHFSQKFRKVLKDELELEANIKLIWRTLRSQDDH